MIKNLLKSLHLTLQSMTWAWDVAAEFYIGLRALIGRGQYITFFGSARLTEQSMDYKNVRELARKFASLGYTIVTGGGPGIMEAANRGAKDGKGFSIGCSIELLKHEPPNAYLSFNLRFKNFSVRKVVLTHFSQIFVVAPGGLGTLDELFEILVLFQTEKIPARPVFLLNRSYWEPLIIYMREVMVKAGTISESDVDLLRVVDKPEEILSQLGLALRVDKSNEASQQDAKSSPPDYPVKRAS